MELAAALARQVDAGLVEQAEGFVKFIKPRHADLLDDLHHRNVARIHQRLGQRLHAVAARVRAVDRLLPVAYHQRAAAVERAVRIHLAQLVGRSDGHELKGGARLVVVGNDRVAPGLHENVDAR